jgi:prepilin-type N-terminal cleavage/methylation domain-containing protein
VERNREAGFTLIELLVGIVLLAIVSIAFYSVLFAASRSATTSREVVGTSEEARLGFGRMVRDTREGRRITSAVLSTSPTAITSYTVEVDFDSSGTISPYPTRNSLGDYEELQYTFDGDRKVVWIAKPSEVLMRDVECVEAAAGVCKPVFSFTSNRLEYDWSGDGVTTWQELDDAPNHGVIGVGNKNLTLDDPELEFVTNVEFKLRVVDGDAQETFYSEAQLRNQR